MTAIRCTAEHQHDSSAVAKSNAIMVTTSNKTARPLPLAARFAILVRHRAKGHPCRFDLR